MYDYFYNFHRKPLGSGLFNQSVIGGSVTPPPPPDLSPDIYCDPTNTDGNHTVYPDGTALATLTNLGTIGSTFNQASGAARPIIINNVVNSNPVFRFSGAQSMTMNSFSGLNYIGPMSIFCVFNAANTGPTQRYLNYQNSWGFYSVAANLQLNLFGAGTFDTTSGLIANNTWYSSAAVYNGTSACDFYINDIKSTSVFPWIMESATTNLYFGSANGASGFMTADVGILLVYFRALMDSETNELNLYLKNRFNL